MPLHHTNSANARIDERLEELAAVGAVKAAHEDAVNRPSKRRLEQLATIWAKQTGRTIVVA
jgi:hypothetical protein